MRAFEMKGAESQLGMPAQLPGVRRLPLDPEAQAGRVGRRIALIVFALVLSVAFGIALVRVKPLFVYGLVSCVLFTLAILRWPYFGLLSYLLIYVLRVGEIYPVLAPLRLERIVGVLTLISLLLALKQLRGRVEFDRSRQSMLLLLLQCAMFLTIPLAYWRTQAITESVDFLKVVIFYFLIVMLVDSRRRFWTFFGAYASLITYLAVVSVHDYVKGSILVAQGIQRAIGSTSAGGGPNELGATMACSIPIPLLLLFQPRLARLRWVFVTMLVLMLVTLVLTGSRSGLLGFLGACGFLIWRSRHRIALGLLALVLAAGMFSVLPEQYKGRYTTMVQSQLDGSSSERIKVWKKGLRMAMERPLTGVGVGCFGTANALGYSAGSRRSYLESHSLYVQVPAELGLVGAVAFFGFLIHAMRFNRRLARAFEEPDQGREWAVEGALLQALLAGYVALLITGVFGHSLMRVTWYLYPALMIALGRIYLTRTGLVGTPAAHKLMG